MIKPYESINTFSRKPVPAQIITYFVFVGELITFFICMYINYKSTPRQIAILVCYLVTVTAQIVITVRVSCIDPSDNIMISYRTDPQNRYFFSHKKDQISTSMNACTATFALAMSRRLRDIVKYAKGTVLN